MSSDTLYPADTFPSAAPLGDDAALASLRAGDAGARDAFYRKHERDVRRILMRILGPSADVDDVLHEVFVRAFGAAHQVDRSEKLSAWLARIAINEAKRWLDRRKRRRWLEVLPWYSVPEREAAAATDEQKDALRRTYRVLDGMPSEARIVFVMRFVERWELKEIASSLRVSLATVKRRLSRAEAAFVGAAEADPVLCEWLSDGERRGAP